MKNERKKKEKKKAKRDIIYKYDVARAHTSA